MFFHPSQADTIVKLTLKLQKHTMDELWAMSGDSSESKLEGVQDAR